MPKEKASYKCLSIIMLDSVVKIKKDIILTSIIKHFRTMQIWNKKTKMENLIDDELDASSSDDETDIAVDDDDETQSDDQPDG